MIPCLFFQRICLEHEPRHVVMPDPNQGTYQELVC